LFIDLDGFKEINDGLGHAAGDLLLAEVGAVLVATLRPEDTVARFGGDEFAVLCEQIAEPKMAEQIAARVVRAVGLLSSPQRAISASVGVALSVGAEKISAATLLAEADEAMYWPSARARRTSRCRRTRRRPVGTAPASPAAFHGRSRIARAAKGYMTCTHCCARRSTTLPAASRSSSAVPTTPSSSSG
jgi:diguanylate cyclase (GGDEF)-like protein